MRSRFSAGLRACLVLALGAMLTLPGLAQAKTTLTMWTFLNLASNGGRERALKEIIAGFERENPDVEISVQSQDWFSLPEKFVMSHSAGQAPDIAWVNGENLGLLINSGVGADLDALFLNRWTKADWDDVLMKTAYDIARADGKHVGVPIMLISQVQLYRKDLFKEAGIDPASIRTWDDLTEAARKLTVVDKATGRVTRWGMGLELAADKGETAALSTAIIGEQGRLFGPGCKPELATPAGERAVMMHVNWLLRDKVASQENLAHSLDDVLDQFGAGRVAMASSGISRYEKIMAEASWDRNALGILPWPSFDGKKPGPQTISGWFAVVSKDSPNRALAGKFVEYMTNRASAALWTDPGGQVPLRHSTWNAAKFADSRFEWMRNVAKLWEESGYWPPPECNVARTYSDLNQAVHQVVLGRKTAMEALREAEKSTTERQQ